MSPAVGNEIVTGTVLWFKAKKGYGFVKPDDGAADIFVHVVDLNTSGIHELIEGQRIRFRRDSHGDGRFFAIEIALIDQSNADKETAQN